MPYNPVTNEWEDEQGAALPVHPPAGGGFGSAPVLANATFDTPAPAPAVRPQDIAPVTPPVVAPEPVGPPPRRVTTTTEVVGKAEKAANKQLADLQAKELEVIRRQGEHEAQKADLEAQQAQQAAAREIERQRERADLTARLDQRVGAETARLDGERDKYASWNIGDAVRSRTVGQNVLAGLAIALGAVGQALTRSNRNAGLDAVLGGLEREFESQKQRVANAEARTAEAQAQKAAALESLELRQAAAERALGMEAKSIALKSGRQDAILKAEALANATEQKAKEREARLYESTRTRVVSEEMRGGGGPGGRAGKPQPGGLVYGPDGKPVTDVGDPKKAAEINKTNQNYAEIRSVLQEIAEDQKRGPVKGYEDYSRRSGLQARALTLMKDLQNAGALDKGAIEVMGAQVGGKLESSLGLAGAKVKTALQVLDRSQQGFLRQQHGLQGDVLQAFAGKGAAPAAGDGGGRMSPAEAKRLQDAIASGDPRAERFRKILSAQGY